jgi:peptidoglycan hydrolase CwlO-like protein
MEVLQHERNEVFDLKAWAEHEQAECREKTRKMQTRSQSSLEILSGLHSGLKNRLKQKNALYGERARQLGLNE